MTAVRRADLTRGAAASRVRVRRSRQRQASPVRARRRRPRRRRGEIVALVGESGCGKTTLARPCSDSSARRAGEVLRRRRAAATTAAEALQAYRRRVQLILQDPTGSLNPRHTVYEAVAEGIRIHKLSGADPEGSVRGRAGRRALAAGRAAPAGAVLPALPARAVRRAAPACRHRRRAGARAGGAGRRRAGVQPGRLDPWRDPGPAAQAARRARPVGCSS